MSRIAKWKLEKTKVKVVFRLQFHATHIPQHGWDKLFISFIPTDSGKATAKTTKANVRNGTCKWADPIYETTRLLQDVKSKQYDEKLYKFVVAMGSSRSSILGEASINLADYADALKPSAVALPLHGCNSGTILHVTIQLLTSKTGFREFEQQRELREGGLQMGTDMNRQDRSSFGKISSSEETANDQPDKVNARVRFRPESKDLPSLEEEVGLNEEYADSAVGFDGSSNTSGSLYAEKHDTSSTHEIDSLKSTVSGDLNGCSHFESPQAEKGDPSDHRILAQGSNEWVQGWGSDYSMDNDLAIAYEENSRLRGSLEVAESSIFELKQEVSSLQSHADELGVETEKFAQQLVSEIASGEELAKEVSVLKSECSKFKDDLEQFKILKVSPQSSRTESSGTDKDYLFQDIQLRQLHGLLLVEDKIRELHKKAYLGFHERDVRFLHSDLESLLGVLQDLKQGTGGAISLLNSVPSEGQNVNEIRETSFQESKQFVLETGFDMDLYQPDSMPHCLSIGGLVSQNPDSVDATDVMKSKSFELLRELDEVKAEKESLARKMDQMECYYEALIQELEINQKQMLGELQNLRSEHSTCMYTIATNKAEMESMQQDINEQNLRFTEERCGLVSINKELERRAITSEAALRRARLNYSIAVGQLQKDLDLLSFQVLSMFETNENLVKQAFSETSQLCFQGYPDIVQNQKGSNDAELLQNVRVKKQLLGGDILLEDLKKSLQMQEELYQKVEEELCEMHLVNIHLDVFSKTLQETLLEATADIILMKKKIDELAQQLELSAESKELLMLNLQSAMDDVQNLNEDKFSCIAKCNDMVLHNQILEAKLETFSDENCLLTRKITEYEELMREYSSYEGKYEACSAEKTELMYLLEKETLTNGNLQLEISSLNGDLKTVKDGYDELASLKENLQKTVNFLQDKLGSLLASYDKQFNGLSLTSNSVPQDLDFKDFLGVFMQLEDIQHNACEKILQLMEENKNLEDEKDIALMSLSTAKAEFLVLKQNFKHDIQDMMTKLGMANAVVEKLQLEVEAIVYKLHFSSEADEKFAKQNKELSADLALLEVELQQITSKNGDLAQKILGLDALTEELGRSRLTISELMQEKQDLMLSLQDKTEESVNLSSELDSLNVALRSLQDELHAERNVKGNLEGAVAGLTSQLNEKHDQLLQLEKLQLEVEAIANKLHFSSEAEQKFAKQNKELSADLALLEVELQQLTSKNGDLAQKILGLDALTEELGRSRLTISELMQEKQDLMLSLQDKTEESVKLASDLESLKECLRSLQDEMHAERNVKDNLEGTVAGLTSQWNEKHDQLLHFSKQKTEELGRSRLTISELMQEKQDLMLSLQDKTEESVNLASDLESLKKCLRSLQYELHAERNVKDNLEGTVAGLTSQLNEKHDQLLHFSKQKTELDHFRRLASDLELDKSRVYHLLLQREECLEKLHEESSCLADFEFQLLEMHEHLLASDVEVTFIRTQYETRLTELSQQLQTSDTHLSELREKHLDVEAMVNRCLAGEVHQFEENARLVTTVESMRSKLSASVGQNRVLSDSNSVIMVQLEEYKNRVATLEASSSKDKNQHALELEQLKYLLVNSEKEIGDLMSSKEELEITVLVLKAKLDEQLGYLTSVKEYNDELVMLQNQCKELTHRLSEQILKTEEFKNLSIHLKELKDKADTECLQVREKREPEGPPVAVQESLRIAFIKEQYETRLQELRHQFSISKKHGEEMLLKLQDAIDEIENRKKSEASHIRRNEELSVKILELEAELNSVVSDKREKVKTYDRINAELECTILSLECCREEKQKLEASLQECIEEKSRIAVELNLTKGQLESSASPTNMQKEENGGSDKVGHMSGKPFIGMVCQENPIADTRSLEIIDTDVTRNGSTGNQFPKYSDQDNLINYEEVEDASSVPIGGGEHSSAPIRDGLISKGMHGISNQDFLDRGALLHGDSKHLAVINDYFKAQSLKSSMDHLHEELERMKNENSLLQDDHHFGPKFEDLRREMMQLNKANEELGSMFPLFNEFSDSGKALERVLALEIELAEALRAKKKSSIHFQSSFVKQHSDEEAVFQSFRDINELIKDMLELKGRHAAVETELREMHDRYSQLSLQFAEVEGERQKLLMTLKNVRASKKPMHLNRSSSATLGDHPS
ncbi:uncharacterized protein LOC132274229 [Cornus florida]|uniref:uncharacterized protein LOC132274229 n=1 Tax=Cornus florida TaxID=4283 RepID=UPI00289A3EA6|nr:uncharacterized protein LOC132274229 [Cornus florida]XP_059631443.1 uncharacterized protein LOC132274229 [Cornus florida]XP_059631444.1 uncharacterized protein LOC132274229 [Cornus florida]XP_059631445.1 uncharacterized protein LOC132274229 [Cornus florida]XP_059631446.1 uncharacterized protein LOC132274229 [Cornus florida]XP_059631447.1 uncharacterized protein LOC132274229 [Cornus florida]